MSRCSLHVLDLCVCMRDVISGFNSEIEVNKGQFMAKFNVTVLDRNCAHRFVQLY